MHYLRRNRTELHRTSKVRVSTHEIAVHWWIYRHCFLAAKQAALDERLALQPGDSQAPQRESETLLHQVPVTDRPTFEAHFQAVRSRVATHDGTQADDDQRSEERRVGK